MPKVFLVRRNAGKTNCYREPCDVRRESIYPLNTYSYFISQLESKSYDYVDPENGFDENGNKVDISHQYCDVSLKNDENNKSVYPKSFRAMPSAISKFPSQSAVFSTTNEQQKINSISTSSQKPFACSICGKSFRLSSTLCRHKIIHTSERPHKCYICFKSFNRSSTLKTHLRTHNKTKEFVCRTCGKGFHQKGNLRNHSLIHTGEKPYSCKVCGKAFNKLSNLKFHMHIHTDQKPYRCRVCKLSMTRRGELKLHIRTCHPESVQKLA